MVESFSHSLITSRGEDLEIEEPVLCRDSASFDFHATLAGVLGPTLVGDEIVQVGEPDKKCLLTPMGMMERFHHKEFPVDGVMGLIEQGAGPRHLRVFEDGIPARFLSPRVL